MASHDRTSWSNSPACAPRDVGQDSNLPRQIGNVPHGRWRERVGTLAASLQRLLVPAAMAKVGMFFLAGDAAAVVSVLGRLGACQIDRAPTELKDFLAPYFPEDFRAACHRLRDQYEPLAERWRLSGVAQLASIEPRVPTAQQLERMSVRLDAVRQHVNRNDGEAKHLLERQTELENLDFHVRALVGLGVDVAALADLRFVHLRAGTVPVENLDRLRESAELGEDLVLSLGKIDDRAHVLVIGAGGISRDLEGLLTKAHFTTLDLPVQRAAASSDEILAKVAAESATVATRLGQLDREASELRGSSATLILEAASLLARATVFGECEGTLESREPAAFLSGWVPQSDLPELERLLRQEVRNPVAVVQESLPRETGPEAQPPSLMPVPLVFRPGARLVTLYGHPGYGEINPTIILAATAPLFFGMMFGDVGQGLLLAILALTLRRRLGNWLAPALACSIGCTVFGFLYGSVFGFEGWLPALWLRPMSEPFRLLAVALWVGVVFLLITYLLKIVNLLLQYRWFEAACGFQGFAGAVFYAGGVIALRALYQGDTVPVTALVFGSGGVLLTAIYTASEIRSHGREAVTNLTAEYFHGLISLFTNTLSFLRLAAFALNHAALSVALFLLVEMIPPTPFGWAARALALVAGSTFILVLDALVVAVQTIRLEFYEGLTRYFRGDGRPYQPLQFPDTKAA